MFHPSPSAGVRLVPGLCVSGRIRLGQCPEAIPGSWPSAIFDRMGAPGAFGSGPLLR